MLRKEIWTQTETEVVAETGESVGEEAIKAKVHLAEEELLRRCLVRYLTGKDDTPTRNEMRRWAQQTWKGAQGVSVYDKNGVTFLFEFQSKKRGAYSDRNLEETRLQAQPTMVESDYRIFPQEPRIQLVWIRVLGLPLHLWSSSLMKKIG